ncbi:MAG TPA: YciI family protein [Candidatus Angelobacter sp.]|nr:YciI family protein [Candidatus Angelobacter sp.]
MRYMLLIYTQEEPEKWTDAERQKVSDSHWKVMDGTQKLGIFRGAEPLQPTATAITVRTQDGKTFTTDGPFAETKEQLAGYYILDSNSIDEVIHWASLIPTACLGGQGCVEIRPMRDIPMRLPGAENGLEPTAARNG